MSHHCQDCGSFCNCDNEPDYVAAPLACSHACPGEPDDDRFALAPDEITREDLDDFV